MKRLIAVLLVVFACFSLSANDIPIDWYIQIVKALDHFTASDFEKYSFDIVGDKTLILRKSHKSNDDGIIDETINEYYFRFNLTQEEIEQDKKEFMEKVGEMFSKGGSLYSTSSEYHKKINSFISYDIGIYGFEHTEISLYYSLNDYSSLTHYVEYSYDKFDVIT